MSDRSGPRPLAELPRLEGTLGRAPFEDPRALAELRRQVLDQVGEDYGEGILYALGFREGMLDGLEVMRRFDGGEPPAPCPVGASIPMVFVPRDGRLGHRFTGELEPCIEAVAALGEEAPVPRCYLTPGYAAGWYSAILDELLLVRELECAAAGASACRFEARRAEDWLERDPEWARALLACLEVERYRDASAHEGPEPLDGRQEGGMLGCFDPMSPAVHVWGPVVVLPYAGLDDGLIAIETLREDLGAESLRVAVIDVTGARIDGVEAVGLGQLQVELVSMGLEVLIAGADRARLEQAGLADADGSLPLLAQDVCEAIALGFQICQATLVRN
jgi:hypothetical protein